MIFTPAGRVLVLMRFGSHLYGTDRPESDTDWKGVFLPPARDILLGRLPKTLTRSTSDSSTKNTAADVDVEWYFLHYFLQLATEGQTVALDMLHAPDHWPEQSSPEWRELRAMRRLFHTRNLKAFVGYARQQAAKYGLKGSRLSAVAGARELLERAFAAKPDQRLSDLWDDLPVGEFVRKVEHHGKRFWEVCGRQLQDTVALEQALEPLRRYEQSYGERAVLAKENRGVDWKAVSHALRAAFEVRSILTAGDIGFPLPERAELLAVKRGELDFLGVALPRLEAVIAEVEALSRESRLPRAVDTIAVDRWLETAVRRYVAGD